MSKVLISLLGMCLATLALAGYLAIPYAILWIYTAITGVKFYGFLFWVICITMAVVLSILTPRS